MKRDLLVALIALSLALVILIGVVPIDIVCEWKQIESEKLQEAGTENTERVDQVESSELTESEKPTATTEPEGEIEETAPQADIIEECPAGYNGDIEAVTWEENLQKGFPAIALQNKLDIEKYVVWNQMYVWVSRVSLHSEPNVESGVVHTLVFTNRVEVCPKVGTEGWARIRFEGYEGYVESDKLMTRDALLAEFHYLYAQAMAAEAMGVSIAEMARTGEVMGNRTATEYWEFAKQNNLTAVLSASGQYPDTWRKIKNGIVPNCEALAICEALLTGYYQRYRDFESNNVFTEEEMHMLNEEDVASLSEVTELIDLTEEEIQFLQDFTDEELEMLLNLTEEEKQMLRDYKRQLPIDTLWQTGFNPEARGWAVDVVAKYFCRYNSDGSKYYHYYAVPAQ